MFVVKKSNQNPLVVPETKELWQSRATFNPSIARSKNKETIHMVYRAMGPGQFLHNEGPDLVSTIGYAKSDDGEIYTNKRQLIFPEHDWEKFGCEDPRATYFEGTYYIFYTALSRYPFSSDGIKIAVAKTRDFQTIDEKHLVTPFNSKAMALFPERINGKMAAVLSAHTDKPPALFTIALFDKEEDIWSEKFWKKWEDDAEYHAFDLRRSPMDQIEVGSQPIRTPYGWLIIYSHIQNYFGGGEKIFGIEAILLDYNDPRIIIGRTRGPIIVPEERFELDGEVPNITFPSGGELIGDYLHVYYGGADTTCAKATVDIHDLVASMRPRDRKEFLLRKSTNPILVANKNNPFEAKAVYNPTAIDLRGSVHILYRAQSEDNTSTIGLMRSADGYTIDEKLNEPIYIPREDFEKKSGENLNSGCEDARIMEIGSRLYITYTAYNGTGIPRVALSSIETGDFIKKEWNWAKPIIISPTDIDDKDAAIIPEKLEKGFLFIHRINGIVCGTYVKDLNFKETVKERIEIMKPRKGLWDGKRIGIAGNPEKIRRGGKSYWLLFYHGISEQGVYRVGAALLDYKDPTIVVSRTTDFIFEPETDYEKYGQVNNVVFPCGQVIRGDTIFLYYGGADQVVGLATLSLKRLLSILK